MTIDLKRYYQNIEDGIPKKELLRQIRTVNSYNEHVNHLISIIFRIIYRDEATPPPDEFQYLFIKGEKWVSWPLWVGKQFSINLLFDGDLVVIDSDGDLIEGLKIRLKHVSDISEMINIEYKDSICTLEDLYNSVSDKRQLLGVDFYPKWPEKATYNQM